jgi:nucleoside-diphosphate-sugar epimerase
VKTLVTGATGFIGTHLVRTLVAQGRDIRCLVRKNSDIKYLRDLGVELFYGDLLHKDSLKDIAKDVNIVYHLAGEVYSNLCRDFYRVNYNGTRNLVAVCLPERIEKFFYLSSIAAVGPNREKNILLDEQTPCRPADAYGRSKLKAEQLLMEFFKNDGFPIIIGRPPTVYGPGGQSKIIKKILHRVQNGRQVIVGNKNNLRSMCYIDNLIQGMLATEHCNNAIGETYFFADARPYTFTEIFQTVAQQAGIVLKEAHLPGFIGSICGFSFKTLSLIGFYSLPLYMAWHMVLDMACEISKAKEQLNYLPYIDIKEGIKKSIKYFLKKEFVPDS